MYYSGICGSQIGEINGVKGKDNFLPHLLGHEGTGIIIDKNKSVKKFKKGDKVILHWQKSEGCDAHSPAYFMGKKKINAGETYQIKICTKYKTKSKIDPLDFFCRLSKSNLAPAFPTLSKLKDCISSPMLKIS